MTSTPASGIPMPHTYRIPIGRLFNTYKDLQDTYRIL